MKAIIIEDRIYKVTEKQYKEIKDFRRNQENAVLNKQIKQDVVDIEMSDFLLQNRPYYKFVDCVWFDFKL